MGIGFIFFLFGLTASAKEDGLQGFQSLQTDSSAAFITTVLPEEQNSSSDNAGKVSTESLAHLTGAVISSLGTDLFHTPDERQHSSTVNATTTTDKNAITSNGPGFVLIYGTGLHSTGSALKPFQSEEDPLLVATDEKRLHPSMSDDTVTPAAHLSRGKEKISAFFHASLESKNQRVLESITPSPANGIPLVSASDPAIIDNLGESNESVERRPENKNENWTLESFRADDPLNSTEEASLNKNHSTIMHFGVLQGAGLLTTKLGQKPRNESEREPKEEKNLLSQSSLILDTPLQVKSTSQVMVNKMTESSKNPGTSGPTPLMVSLKHSGLMFLFSASKLTPTKTPDASTANYFSSIVTAAGEMHVIKLTEASRLISDSMHRIVSARDELERKLILHAKSQKEQQIKATLQTLPTGFRHRLSLTSQNSLSLLKMPDLCAKEAKTSNISVKETHNRIDNSSERISFSTASFTNAEEATTASDIFMKQTQSSLATPQTLSPQTESSKHSGQFDELSTAAPLSTPLTMPKNVFQIFKVNDHRFLSETLKPFVSIQVHESSPPSFTSTTVKRFTNREDFSKIDSTVQNQHHSKVLSIIFERPNINLIRLSKHTTTVNKSMSRFVLPTHLTPKDNIYTMISKPQVYIANISNTLPQKKNILLPTSLSKSQNTATTDAKRVLSKLLSISKKSNSESAFLNHSVTTGEIGSPLDDKQQDLKNPRGTVRLLFGSHTVSSIPSVQQPTEAHPREGFLTETAQSELQIEPYLKKRDGTAKPTKLIPNSRSVAGIYQTPLTSISHPSTEFKQDLSFAASPLVSIEQNIGHDYLKESVLSHHVFVNLSTLLKHPWKITSNRISGISRHKTAAAGPEGALNTSPLESSTSPTSPLFSFRMQNVLRKEHLSLTEDQTQFLSTVYEHSQTQSNFPLGVTEDVEKQLGRMALSAVTGEKLSPVVHTDLSFSSTEAQSLPKGSLQSRGGSADISHGATPFAESDSARSAEVESDLPVINTKRGVIAADSLTGLAQISDDICGSGNYTAEMSLNLERDIMPGDLIPALGNLRVVISLKTNNSQVNLEIKSCCLSPTVRLDEFNTTCCIFSRLPIDPHGIRLIPGVPSKKASFTISLFQMINYSSAYLHCDLSVCLRNHSECERQCVQRRNAHLQEEAGGIFSRMGNRISFGPVLKGADNSSFSEAADDTEAMEVIISSVAGCLLACLALSLVWMANRRCLQRSAYCWSRASCEC